MTWLDNSVIYHIFIDRFAGFEGTDEWEEPVYLGGNIRGIIDKLPYLTDLGVNVIWISPFCKGVAYHGYHVTDFYSVDEHFGNEEDIKNLIDIAHSHNMKIICDFVPNHCSDQHPFFIDAQKNQNSIYRDWFNFRSWPNDYECFLSFRDLPKLNLDSNEAREHIIGSARKWLQAGFDGLRIDHVIGLSNSNLKKILEPLRLEFPEAVFVGEAWMSGMRYKELKTIRIPHKLLIRMFDLKRLLYRNYIGILDGILDFQTAEYLEKYALKGGKFGHKITYKPMRYGNQLLSLTFLDNHDMERFLFRCGGDVEKLKKAASLQFSLKNPAIIYYGTEIGLSQDKPFSAKANNPDILARKPMEWAESKQNTDLLEYYRSLIKHKTQS